MKMPQDQTKRISLPSKMKLAAPADSAERMDKICCATTDSTSMLMRLNSSKQPHAPVWKQIHKCTSHAQMYYAMSHDNYSILWIVLWFIHKCLYRIFEPEQDQNTCAPWI